MTQITDHKHCEICGKVVDPADRWCSPECQEKHDDVQKQKKRSAILLVAIIVIAIVLTKIPSPF